MLRLGQILVASLTLVVACSNSADLGGGGDGDGGADGGGGGESGAGPKVPDSGSTGVLDGGGVRCWPDDPSPGYDTVCDPVAQMCVHDYAHVSQYPNPNSCQPIVADCSSDRSCECVLKVFKCGITTTCSVAPGGLVRVVCQPD
jgi:hypothetical protein